MKKKGTQTVENATEEELKPTEATEEELKPTEVTEEELKRRRRQTEQQKLTAAAKRAKGGEGVLGMDRRRARAPRRRRTILTVEARHRRRSHAPTRALTRRRVDGEAAGENTRVTARGRSDSGGEATGV